MSDPLVVISAAFERAIAAALGPDLAGTDPALRRSDRADLQANVAMAVAKRVGKPPREVAAAIVGALALDEACERIEIAGPGFINLTLRPGFVAAAVGALAADTRLGVPLTMAPETVVVDYSAPNVAKEMHVGHIRSTIIGDALVRVLELQGHRVVRQNHLGDWGTPFGMLIEELVDRGLGSADDLSSADLNALYKGARAKFDGDPGFAERARTRVVRLQAGDEETLATWRKLVEASQRYFTAIYERLGVTLREKDFAGESFYNDRLPAVVAELEEKGLAVPSEGALCVFPPGFTGKEDKPLPLIVRKQDGGYGYATTDLAAIRYRLLELGATRVLYVVGAPQSQHLAMIRASAVAAGWLVAPARAEHVAFGSILGPDKKPFKTRAGETVRLVDLLDEAVERATAVVTERSADLDEPTRAAVARAVGIGALKYGDLASDRVKDYVFEWSRMLALDGNTAPYLQYAHARCRSIARKAEGDVGSAFSFTDPAEKALGLELLAFPAAVAEVAETLQPHKLCTYLYGLGVAFSSFYEKCPVLKAEGDVRRARLALCELTARTLARGLDLLGIEAPERM